MKLTDFDLYKDLLKEKSGLIITPDKSYLLESRLNPVAKKWGYPSLEAMTVVLQGVPDKDLVIDIVEAMTTNETSFFRDGHPYETLKNTVMPLLKENRQVKNTCRIWCAASSSGQEPYSIALLLKENILPQYSSWTFNIHATDISHDILDQAREGVFSQFEVQRGLPIQLLMKYFTQTAEKWQLKPDIRKMVTFDYFNLLDDMSRLGTFDVIFCRNVLIYFDEETKRKVMEGLCNRLVDDGFLFLGGAETVLGISDKFKPLPGSRGLYVKNNSKYLQKDETALAQGG